MIKTQRQICVDALIDVYVNKAYSTIVLDKYLNKQKDVNKNYITKLFYGVLERDITLEHIINTYSKKPCTKLDSAITVILKLGLYELKYMDSVPDSAAVNESVQLCRYKRKNSATSFVNAILRSFIRDDKAIKINKSDRNYLSVMYSAPRWIIDKWTAQYGKANAEKILQSSTNPPVIYARVNTKKTNTAQLLEVLVKENIKAKACDYIENCIILEKPGDIENINAFNEGLFYIQDLSSQFCAKILNAKPNNLVYDICAAPGSKSFTIAQYMNDEGEIKAFDIHAHKIELINKAAAKLDLTCVKSEISDAIKFNADLIKADKVLCDVPCSGLGIIRKKPDIKFKEKNSIDKLPKLQLDILRNASNYVKDGGELVYSTCTLNCAENEDVVKAFLAENEEFSLCDVELELDKLAVVDENMVTFLPYLIDIDGFFIAKFKKSVKRSDKFDNM